MKQLIQFNKSYLAIGLLGLFVSCKKDLPKLPQVGDQGTFCWEQFQNNSFDPTNEWVDSDPNDFTPCNLPTVNVHQANAHRYNVQFAKNNPNVIYYVRKTCESYPCSGGQEYRIAKYNFCTHKEEIINANLINENNFDDLYLNAFSIGNDSEVFLLKKQLFNSENLYEFEHYYSNDDANSYVLDTGLYKTHVSASHIIIPGQDKLIYNEINHPESEYRFLIYDFYQNTYDTLNHLSNYYIHQWINNNKWIVRSKGNSPDFFEYESTTETLIPISELQNVDIYGYEHADIAFSDNRAVIMSYEHIVDSDYGIGDNTTVFNINDYNKLLLKGVSMSPNGEFLVAVVNHIKWVSNCDQEGRNYLLVFNLQTGDWKAIDFDN